MIVPKCPLDGEFTVADAGSAVCDIDSVGAWGLTHCDADCQDESVQHHPSYAAELVALQLLKVYDLFSMHFLSYCPLAHRIAMKCKVLDCHASCPCLSLLFACSWLWEKG